MQTTFNMRNTYSTDDSTISFGPHNPTAAREHFKYTKQQNNTGGTQRTTFVDPFSASNTAYVPAYLYNNIELWVWDWDDTLLDTGAYLRHPMSREYILALSDSVLTRDFPHWQYFRDLCTQLVTNGKRVGIASFGTYSVIRAYMDRVFGHEQKIFNGANIIAAVRDIGSARAIRDTPINKNAYIQRLMNHYRITDHDRVILFDDLPSNIADAVAFGVLAYQIPASDTDTNIRQLRPQAEFITSQESALYSTAPTAETQQQPARDHMTVLFGPQTLYDIGRNFEAQCVPENIFSQIGDRKTWKNQSQYKADSKRRILRPTSRAGSELGSRNNAADNFENILASNKGGTSCLQGIQGCEFNMSSSPLNELNKYDEAINSEKWYRCDEKTGKCEILSPGELNQFKDTRQSPGQDGNMNEGFRGCTTCQSSGPTWVIGLLLLVLLVLIWWCFVKGKMSMPGF